MDPQQLIAMLQALKAKQAQGQPADSQDSLTSGAPQQQEAPDQNALTSGAPQAGPPQSLPPQMLQALAAQQGQQQQPPPQIPQPQQANTAVPLQAFGTQQKDSSDDKNVTSLALKPLADPNIYVQNRIDQTLFPNGKTKGGTAKLFLANLLGGMAGQKQSLQEQVRQRAVEEWKMKQSAQQTQISEGKLQQTIEALKNAQDKWQTLAALKQQNDSEKNKIAQAKVDLSASVQPALIALKNAQATKAQKETALLAIKEKLAPLTMGLAGEAGYKAAIANLSSPVIDAQGRYDPAATSANQALSKRLQDTSEVEAYMVKGEWMTTGTQRTSQASQDINTGLTTTNTSSQKVFGNSPGGQPQRPAGPDIQQMGPIGDRMLPPALPPGQNPQLPGGAAIDPSQPSPFLQGQQAVQSQLAQQPPPQGQQPPPQGQPSPQQSQPIPQPPSAQQSVIPSQANPQTSPAPQPVQANPQAVIKQQQKVAQSIPGVKTSTLPLPNKQPNTTLPPNLAQNTNAAKGMNPDMEGDWKPPSSLSGKRPPISPKVASDYQGKSFAASQSLLDLGTLFDAAKSGKFDGTMKTALAYFQAGSHIPAAILGRVAGTSDSDAKIIAALNHLTEEIQQPRLLMGGSGFRGPEAFEALQALRGNIMGDPKATIETLRRSMQIFVGMKSAAELPLQGPRPALDKETVKHYIRIADGDKDIAQQLARTDGWGRP